MKTVHTKTLEQFKKKYNCGFKTLHISFKPEYNCFKNHPNIYWNGIMNNTMPLRANIIVPFDHLDQVVTMLLNDNVQLL
jgi:hypothetical protein